jgi:hypothetical protein
MTYVIIGTAVFLLLLGFVVGYLLGWRSGHLIGLDYAMRLNVFGMGGYMPLLDDVAEYTKDIAKENGDRYKSVKEETLAKLKEIRDNGIN